jgi:lipopolysaccharide export LptBFGC system permease protein LptF
MKFDVYDLRLELGKTLAAWGARLREHEMSSDELNEKIRKMKILGQDTTFQEIELQKRYAIPFACIVFGLIGVPWEFKPSFSRVRFRSHSRIAVGYYVSDSLRHIIKNDTLLAGGCPIFSLLASASPPRQEQ